MKKTTSENEVIDWMDQETELKTQSGKRIINHRTIKGKGRVSSLMEKVNGSRMPRKRV